MPPSTLWNGLYYEQNTGYLSFQSPVQTHSPKLVFSCQMGHCLMNASVADETLRTHSKRGYYSLPGNQKSDNHDISLCYQIWVSIQGFKLNLTTISVSNFTFMTNKSNKVTNNPTLPWFPFLVFFVSFCSVYFLGFLCSSSCLVHFSLSYRLPQFVHSLQHKTPKEILSEATDSCFTINKRRKLF